jgi:hypothetical protein
MVYDGILNVEQNFKSSVLFYKGAVVASATRKPFAQEVGVENGEVVDDFGVVLEFCFEEFCDFQTRSKSILFK